MLVLVVRYPQGLQRVIARFSIVLFTLSWRILQGRCSMCQITRIDYGYVAPFRSGVVKNQSGVKSVKLEASNRISRKSQKLKAEARYSKRRSNVNIKLVKVKSNC